MQELIDDTDWWTTGLLYGFRIEPFIVLQPEVEAGQYVRPGFSHWLQSRVHMNAFICAFLKWRDATCHHGDFIERRADKLFTVRKRIRKREQQGRSR